MDGSNFEIRPANDDEMKQFGAVGNYVFANNRLPNEDEPPPPLMSQWSLAAFHGDRVVATSGGYPFRMRFNGKAIATDGVTAVGTYPGYRRRGLVRQMISGLIHRAHENEVPTSILWASMGAIYQRFGYGLASTQVSYRLRPEYMQFQFGEPAEGHTRLLDKDGALDHCKFVYRMFGSGRTLLLHRAEVLWDIMFRRAEDQHTHVAVHFTDDEQPDAYCLYQTKWTDGDAPGPNQVLNVLDFAWVDMNGYRGMWEYLASHDLVKRIDWWNAPEDDPAPEMMLEPRMLERRTGDGIWLRVNDVDATLAGRGYDMPGEATVRVREDDICPWNVGSYRISTSGEETEVEKLSGSPNVDLDVTVNGLASLVSGHSSATTLHRIGRVEASNPNKLPELDSLFSTRHRPTCANGF